MAPRQSPSRLRTNFVFAAGVVVGVMVSMLVMPTWTSPSPPALPAAHTEGHGSRVRTPVGVNGIDTHDSMPPPAPSLTRAPQPAVPATGVAGVAAVQSQEDDGDDEPQGLQPGGTVSTEPADSGAVPCTHQDGQQDSGADHAPQSPAASAVVFRPTDVAHMLEPRSFAGVDPSATPLTCEQLRQIRATPVMPASGVQPLFLEWYYRCIYEPMVITKSRPVKAIVWRRKPKETAGFGNQLRGEYGAFIMALVSERLYLIDDNMMDFYFAPPPGIEWRYSKLKHLLPKSKPFSMKKELLQEIPTANMDTWLGKHKVLESLYMWSMDAELGDNPQVQRMYERVLFASLSGYRRIGMVMEWMLQAPSQPFLTAVAKARRKIGFGQQPFLAIQFRTFKSGKYYDKFLADAKSGKVFQCVEHMLQEWKDTQALVGRPEATLPTNIFFTTDRAREFTLERMQRELGRHGTVYMNEGSYEPSGKMGARAWRQVSQALVDWYLLGEASPTIIGGTSYGISAAARVGFRNGLYVIAGKLCDGDYHSPPRLRPDPWRDLTI